MRAQVLFFVLLIFAACGDETLSSPADEKDAAGGAPVGASRSDAGKSRDAGSLTVRDAEVDAPSEEDGGLEQGDAGSMPVEEADAGSEDASLSARLPPVGSTDGDGPYETKQELETGPSTSSGIFRPAELGKGGVKHPIFVWGCGGTTTPETYADVLNQVASHGFVVVAEVAEVGDNGAPLKASIDWILAENERADSVFHQRLDTSKVALGGHSIGSVNSFYIATDARLTTTIHVAGGSLDNVNNPFAATTGMGGKKLVHPVAYICSQSDTFGNVEKTEKDYANTSVPAFMTTITGADHLSATRDGLPAIIAWLRWQLAGEHGRRAAFLDAKGEFSSGRYVSKNKNW